MPELVGSAVQVPAGAWVRSRRLPGGSARSFRPEPTWNGSWHLSSGDQRWGPAFVTGPHVVTACGRSLTAAVQLRYDGVPVADLVVADGTPGVDVCRRCARVAGLTVEAVPRDRREVVAT